MSFYHPGVLCGHILLFFNSTGFLPKMQKENIIVLKTKVTIWKPYLSRSYFGFRLVLVSGCSAQRLLCQRRADPTGGRVRSHVPQRLREGGEAAPRGAAASEGAGAAEGDRREGKVWLFFCELKMDKPEQIKYSKRSSPSL